MAKCSFCGSTIPLGTGKMLVLNSGKILNFDSNKCEKNMFKLHRNPRFLKWTKVYEKGVKAKATE